MVHAFILLLFNSKLAGLNPRQNLVQIGQMLMHCATEHYNVIHIHTCKHFQANQLLIHKMLKCARCIGEPEGHNFELEQTPLTIECCMMLVLRVDFNLMITLL